MQKEKENVLAECRTHGVVFVMHYIIAALFAIMGLLFLLVAAGSKTDKAGSLVVALVFIALGAMFVLEAIVCKKTTYIALTETKIVGHIGFIKTKSITTPLSKVQDIGIENGLMGKIFGYHTITVSSAGSSGAEYEFKHMKNAQAFVDMVLEQIDKVK